ncbi:hypothetical protein [uncultured Legionella sp.]|uniref:hypothetical protein n=1 Tax=uncultured Legionella sp. TaxID=210934 RepID=UPI00261CCDF6|nr:hypothetical protein [uncultured Legionella sp.]
MPFDVVRKILTSDKLPSKNRTQFHNNNYLQESITFGDQHGNTLKILASLITAGIVTLNREDYLRFSELYKMKVLGVSDLDEIRENYNLILAQRNALLEILNRIKPGNTKACVRFIGDIVCDRGADDGMTMALLYKLDQFRIPVKILYSNHDIGLIAYMENTITTGNRANFEKFGLCLENPDSEEAIQLNPSNLEPCEAASLLGLVIGLDEDKINWKDTRLHYETAYKNKLCLIDYEIDNSGSMYIYTHASVALSVLLEVAEELGVPIPNKITTAYDLASFIDALNEEFAVAKGLESIRKSDRNKLSESTGLTALAWSRNSGRNCTINPPQGFEALSRQITFVHGHGSDRNKAGNRHSIDDSTFKIIYMDGDEGFSTVYFASNTNINKQYQPNTQKTHLHTVELTQEDHRKTLLTKIIDTLVKNIEMKKNGRYSTRNSEWKSKLLTTISTQLQQENVFDHHAENNYLSEIRNICAQRRNIFHFWAKPHSAVEFEQLLQKEKLLHLEKTSRPQQYSIN